MEKRTNHWKSFTSFKACKISTSPKGSSAVLQGVLNKLIYRGIFSTVNWLILQVASKYSMAKKMLDDELIA